MPTVEAGKVSASAAPSFIGVFALRNDLLSSGLAPKLLDDGADGGRKAAIRGQLQILLVSSHCFFVLLGTLVGGPKELVNHRLGIRKLIDGLAKLEDGLVILSFVFEDSSQSHVCLRLKPSPLSDCSPKRLNRFLRKGSLAIDASFDGRGLRVSRTSAPRRFDLIKGVLVLI